MTIDRWQLTDDKCQLKRNRMDIGSHEMYRIGIDFVVTSQSIYKELWNQQADVSDDFIG